ncbi:multicopper oxidase domain-containing protein [Nostoc flagelliforme FACHB-838]|uniref:Multicopper oxidase domain-containing protein n=2 Tax=Nostoc flagelliforme TaxID=1306274 RepID=A0ABR8DVL1_9NOSO|nr:multicopper oxidase domain-containing protein [Nostoc flagelliforme FACHB-838]
MLTRKQFLTMSAGLGAGVLLPELLKGKRTYAASPSLSKFTESLPISYPISPPSTLDIAPGTHSFHSSLGSSTTWGYGGLSYLGPTFEVTRGTPVRIRAFNKLGTHPLAGSVDTNLHGVSASDITNPRTVIHLHGSNTEPDSDGYPEDTYLPGQSNVYNYNNNQEAGTLWYHDHSLGMTALNLQAGLAGMYLIRDEDDPIGGNGPLGIPAGAPYEIPLVLQDHSFDSNGSMSFPTTWKTEVYADVAVVNGKAWPNLNVDRTLYRFRIVNASNSRFFRLKLSSNQQLIQIGSDGGLLNAPVYLSKLLLGPGERADVLIDFSQSLPGDKIVLQNDAAAPYPKGLATVIAQGFFKMPEVMQFTVNQGAAVPKAIPTRLRVNNPLITKIATKPVKERNLVLIDILNSNFQVLAMILNAVYWHEAANHLELREQPQVDTVEQWNFINLQPFAHTMHLHLVPFQILNRQSINDSAYSAAYRATGPRKVLMHHATPGDTVPYGYPPLDPTPYLKGLAKPPAANEAGWKDTVVVNPFEVVRLIVPFGAKATANLPFGNSFTGRFVWHCHMLNHEDNDMMLPFDVLP